MLTVLIYALVIVYAQMKVQKLYLRGDTTHQETINRDALASKSNFTFEEMDFNVGFSLFNNDYTKRHNMSLI